METIIEIKIYEVRGKKVMLDFDLAEIYGTETKRLKEAVKRNPKRFPPDFMFVLNQEEWESLRSQIATSNRGGRRYLPSAFTEHGVTMLASVVNSDKAIDMNVAIVRAFIGLKQLATNQNIKATDSPTIQKIMERLSEHDVQLSQIYDAIENLLDEKTEQKTWENRERIGFKK